MSTPMMQQYQEIKAQVGDAILFFRLGDFYEMFGADAELAAPILEIALTGREAGEARRIPMCGVPYHSVEHYLPKLVAAGHKVAICEQVEDPKLAKGIVKREIIRIVSPGTLTDGLLSGQDNNFLAGVWHDGAWGLSFLDVTTGEFTIFETESLDSLQAELAHVRPAELLLPKELLKQAKPWQPYYCTVRERRDYVDTEALREHFAGQAALLEDHPVAAGAASALWRYFLASVPGMTPSNVLEIKLYNQDRWMILDSWTRRNLELSESLRGKGKKGTLLSVLDLTKTAAGARLLKRWLEQPLLSVSEIETRLAAVEELYRDEFLRSDVQKLLDEVYDLERLMGKVSYGSAQARDLLALAQTLDVPPLLRALLAPQAEPLASYLRQEGELAVLKEKLTDALNPDIVTGSAQTNLIRAGYSAEVDELRAVASGGRDWMAALETSEKERTGIRSLKIGYNKVFGYYIEVTHANAGLIPGDYQRKQTLANAERFVTPELKEYEEKILTAETRLGQLEYDIFVALREEVRRHTEEILKLAQELAQIDVFAGLAEAAVRYNYVRPEISTAGEIRISEGRHPVVEQMLGTQAFVPNDTSLTADNHLGIITGPNMAGKSTYMRQVALIVLMAQMGSFVPAQKAKISLVDRIFTRVGAADDLAAGQSTFMVEMQEVAYILRHATSASLVIFDEVGRGTATFDGLSIAWALVEHLQQHPALKPKTLFATHYHELTQLGELPGSFNLHVGVKEKGEDIVFLHKILPGKADRSYGIQVARLAGVPAELLQRAKVLLHTLEESSQQETLMEAAAVTQLALFEEPETHPLLDEIGALPLEDMSPRQALEYLFDLRTRLKTMDA
ncbi:DNA mismatch repair protein MutS [Peptococcaceae bacterium CEB3]|nr:DNA mismatch repair protein MutS [Peptococcaceae bacterium CEB3]